MLEGARRATGNTPEHAGGAGGVSSWSRYAVRGGRSGARDADAVKEAQRPVGSRRDTGPNRQVQTGAAPRTRAKPGALHAQSFTKRRLPSSPIGLRADGATWTTLPVRGLPRRRADLQPL